MALTIVILIIILMLKLGSKGKAYREEQRMSQAGLTPQEIKENAYRAELQKQGIDDDLITIILPTIMNDK